MTVSEVRVAAVSTRKTRTSSLAKNTLPSREGVLALVVQEKMTSGTWRRPGTSTYQMRAKTMIHTCSSGACPPWYGTCRPQASIPMAYLQKWKISSSVRC